MSLTNLPISAVGASVIKPVSPSDVLTLTYLATPLIEPSRLGRFFKESKAASGQPGHTGAGKRRKPLAFFSFLAGEEDDTDRVSSTEQTPTPTVRALAAAAEIAADQGDEVSDNTDNDDGDDVDDHVERHGSIHLVHSDILGQLQPNGYPHSQRTLSTSQVNPHTAAMVLTAGQKVDHHQPAVVVLNLCNKYEVTQAMAGGALLIHLNHECVPLRKSWEGQSQRKRTVRRLIRVVGAVSGTIVLGFFWSKRVSPQPRSAPISLAPLPSVSLISRQGWIVLFQHAQAWLQEYIAKLLVEIDSYWTSLTRYLPASFHSSSVSSTGDRPTTLPSWLARKQHWLLVSLCMIALAISVKPPSKGYTLQSTLHNGRREYFLVRNDVCRRSFK
ncbi:hypothetical protein BZG36_00762 [Bifiguratus adelaidae]|uniref:Uncharacterized protein n=1 Tax=Bifiguratus adelaidae TaxID=1938954 RepID=A0A261Y6K9_9FUNG|nr:hypothetical protein BZG36_00762 [Bifiguratus adelaidae]